MRAGGETLGMLITFHTGRANPSDRKIRLLQLLTALLSTPVALCNEQVT